MIRTTGFSGFPRFLTTFATAACVAITLLSCTENGSPLSPYGGQSAIRADGLIEVHFSYPDSVRYGNGSDWVTYSLPLSSTVVADMVSGAAMDFVAPTSNPTYTVSSVAFTPEPAPATNLPIQDFTPVVGVPIGFTFNFFGNAYTTLNVSPEGLVQFGKLTKDGCCWGWFIPHNDEISNVIALGWSAWSVGFVSKPVKYETRGTAPNRIFVLQFNNVPEDGGSGHLTAQLVLYERTSDIIIYTTQLNTSVKRHSITQGIENAAGNEAYFVKGRDSSLFAISNDAVKFALAHVNTPPVIAATNAISVSTDPGVCVANLSAVSPAVSDDAAGATVVGSRSDGLALSSPFPKGVTTITWTATDAEGLKSSITQQVTVSDNEKPTIVAPQNITARVNKGVSFASVDVGQATAKDNCPDVKVSGVRNTDAPLNAGYPVGVTTITWTATDGSNNTASATQTVTVVGNQPPVVTPPANISVNTDQRACSAVLDPGVASVKDDTDGATVAGVRNDGQPLNAAYPKGVTTIHWTATDFDGLQATADQSVTVSDKEKPGVTAPANISVGNDPTHNYAVVSALGAPSAEDNCPGVNVSGSRSDGQALGNTYPVGVTTIVWTAVDASGNSASASQTITVRDVEAPHVMVPNEFSVNATMPSGAVVTFSVTAVDNVGVTSLVCSPASGSLFPIGYSEIHCEARDAAGNSASGEFGVEVMDAHDQLVNLIDYVRSLGLSNGVENPLVNQLRAADRDGADPQACTKLDDFVHMISVKDGSLTNEWSTHMRLEARRIQAVLGCASVGVSANRVSLPKNGLQFNRNPSR